MRTRGPPRAPFRLNHAPACTAFDDAEEAEAEAEVEADDVDEEEEEEEAAAGLPAAAWAAATARMCCWRAL